LTSVVALEHSETSAMLIDTSRRYQPDFFSLNKRLYQMGFIGRKFVFKLLVELVQFSIGIAENAV